MNRTRAGRRAVDMAERTFIHWVHMAVIVRLHGLRLRRRGRPVHLAGGALPGRVLRGHALRRRVRASLRALLTYRWRARHILAKDQPEWGDPQGPLLVTCRRRLHALVRVGRGDEGVSDSVRRPVTPRPLSFLVYIVITSQLVAYPPGKLSSNARASYTSR